MIFILSVKNLTRILMVLMFCLTSVSSVSASDFNPHELSDATSESNVQCLSCHKSMPSTTKKISGKHIIPEMKKFVKSETLMCADCHGDDNTGHIVGVTAEYTVPADLPLDKNNQVTCLSCHYFHGSLKSSKPMASTSFMDHLFNRQRLNKSYILRRNNAKGDLCLACHGKS